MQFCNMLNHSGKNVSAGIVSQFVVSQPAEWFILGINALFEVIPPERVMNIRGFIVGHRGYYT